MKKVIFTLLSICLLYLGSNGQACTGANISGPGICIPIVIDSPGLSPLSGALSPEINGSSCVNVIHFKNYNTFVFGGTTITIQTLGIDSITNLPSGLCWATNKTNNTFSNQENGCIAVFGTCCSPPGQYRLGIYVAAGIGVGNPLHTSAAAVGLYYYVRVNNLIDSAARAVDTTGQSVSADSTKFRGYSTSGTNINEVAICTPYLGPCLNDGVVEILPSVSSLSIVPNPFNNKAVVSFYSDKEAVMSEKLTNMLGSVIYSRDMQVRMGENSALIEKNALPSGIYFYTLSNGRSLITKRVVITE